MSGINSPGLNHNTIANNTKYATLIMISSFTQLPSLKRYLSKFSKVDMFYSMAGYNTMQ